jgi:hypothetical protein
MQHELPIRYSHPFMNTHPPELSYVNLFPLQITQSQVFCYSNRKQTKTYSLEREEKERGESFRTSKRLPKGNYI